MRPITKENDMGQQEDSLVSAHRKGTPEEKAPVIDRRRRAYRLIMFLGLALLALSLVCGISISSSYIAFDQVLRILAARLLPAGWINVEAIRQVDTQIVWLVRVPRCLLAALVGAMLSVAGAQMQGLFRNPMASPTVIGTSQGAAFGSVIALATGLAVRSLLYIPLFAFIGALTALLLLAFFSMRSRNLSLGMLLLAGVALNFLFGAGVSLVLSLSLQRWEVAVQIMGWLMGGLESRSWSHVAIAAPCFIVAFVIGQCLARDADLMLEGEESARSLGVAIERVKHVMLTCAAILTAGATSTAGIIGFVGLLIPHIVRLIIGPSHRRLFPACALTGAWFLVFADLLCRTLRRPEEIQLGIITSAIGTPFFLYLLLRDRRKMVMR